MLLGDVKDGDVVAALESVAKMVSLKIDQLEQKANDTIPKPMKIKQWPKLSDYRFDTGFSSFVTLDHSQSSCWFQSKNSYGTASDMASVAAVEKRKAEILSLIDKVESDSAEVEQFNKIADANNKAIHEKIRLMMQHIGVPNTYRVRNTKSKSMYPKYDTVCAGYISDLTNHVPLVSQYGKPDIKALKVALDSSYREALRKVMAAEQIKIKKEEDAQKMHQIALLRAKYTPENATSDEHEILSAILEKDKYLRLAYYLEKNRNDWSDGPDYATAGIDSFEVDTSVDELIFDEIKGLIDSWDGDGRVFRDCEYNYNFIYSIVRDESLKKDLATYKECFNN